MKNIVTVIILLGSSLSALATGPTAFMSGPKNISFQQWSFTSQNSDPTNNDTLTVSVDIDKSTYQGCYASSSYQAVQTDAHTYVISKQMRAVPASLCKTPHTIQTGLTLTFSLPSYSYMNILVPPGTVVGPYTQK